MNLQSVRVNTVPSPLHKHTNALLPKVPATGHVVTDLGGGGSLQFPQLFPLYPR